MKKLIKYILIAALVFVIFYIILNSSIIKELLSLIFISFILAYTLKPLHLSIVNRGVNKRLSAITIILGLFLIVIISFVYLIPSVFRESANFNASFQELDNLVTNISKGIKRISSNKYIFSIIKNANSKIDGIVADTFDGISSSVIGYTDNLLEFAVAPILIYYFLVDDEMILNKILIFVPINCRKLIRKILLDIDKILNRYIVGQLLLSVLVGLITFNILLIYKINFPVILSLINGIFNIIPYFGPLFGAIPCIIIAFLKSPKDALWICIWLYALQQIEGNVISPKITGDSVSMHPLSVILLLIVGGKLFGFLGMVLAIPLGVIIKIVYEDLNYYLF